MSVKKTTGSARSKNGNYLFNKVKPIILYCWDFRCYVCGKQGLDNHVHHVDHNHWNNLPVNLIPLCPVHHRMVHKNLFTVNVVYPDRVAERLLLLEDNLRKMYFF